MSILILVVWLLLAFVVVELVARGIYYFRKPEFRFLQKILLIFFGRWLISEYSTSSAYIEEIAASLGVDTGFMVNVLSEASGKDPREIQRIFLSREGEKELYRLAPTTGFVPIPDQNLTHMNINAQGFRGKSVQVKKGPGVKRVLLLGGSVAFGRTATSDAASIACQLENLLNYSTDPARKGRWEVINFAVPDFITWQELALLMNKGVSYEPDIVISLTGFNDAHHYLATGRVNLPASMQGVTAAYNAFSGSPLHRITAFLGTFFISVQFIGRVFRHTDSPEEEELSPFIYTIW